MLQRLLGPTSASTMLKEGLDASSRRTRIISHRVANATTPAGADGFDAVLNGAAANAEAEGVDLEQEMVALADEQIRYDAATRLLHKVYQQVRSSVQGG